MLLVSAAHLLLAPVCLKVGRIERRLCLVPEGAPRGRRPKMSLIRVKRHALSTGSASVPVG